MAQFRPVCLAVVFLASLPLGCASHRSLKHVVVVPSPVRQGGQRGISSSVVKKPVQIRNLGTGDGLGREVYVNNLILANAAGESRTLSAKAVHRAR